MEHHPDTSHAAMAEIQSLFSGDRIISKEL
jgi:hypothetical protein